jgi:hypothetical protein
MALLIVVVLVVGAAIAVGMIVSSMLQKQKPGSTDLVIEDGSATLLGSALSVKLSLVPVGTEPISISKIEVYKGTSTVSYTSSTVYTANTLYPGSQYEVNVILFGVSGVSSGDTLMVVVYWQGIGSQGVSGASKYQVEVKSG